MAAKANMVVGQSGGPTAVINNSLVGIVHQALSQDEIGGIYGMLHGIAGVLNENFIDLRQESRETLELLRYTPASALGTVRYKVKEEDYDRLIDVLQKYDIRYFLYIGGNDSMDTTYKISQAARARNYELCAVGVPKTIDNDLTKTDHCPGYGSAARFVATAIRNTGYDTEAMGESGPIKLMEVMGRNAGWLTAAAALAKNGQADPPHLVYVPERGVSREQIVSDVERTLDRYGFCVAAISEGLKDEEGQEFGANVGPQAVDAFGHKAKGGVVEAVAALIRNEVGIRARFDKPSYLQRSFAELQSHVDREEAYQTGGEAVRAAMDGETGKMVTLIRDTGPVYTIDMGLADLDDIANQEKLLPKEYINAAGNGVTRAFLDYARPLIGDPLPRYVRLAKVPVEKK